MCAGYCGVNPLQVFLAAPLLVLVDLRLGPGPIGVASLLLNLLIVRRGGRGRADPAIRWAIAGVVPGTIAAGATLAVLVPVGQAWAP